MPAWLAEVGSLCWKTLQGVLQGAVLWSLLGLSSRCTCIFNLRLFFLPSAGTHTQSCYYWLLHAADSYSEGKVILSSTPLPCHVRHMLMKDRFWHPFSSVALKLQYKIHYKWRCNCYFTSIYIYNNTKAILQVPLCLSNPKPYSKKCSTFYAWIGINVALMYIQCFKIKMFLLIFYYWQSLNSHILDYTKAESLGRHFKGFFRLLFFSPCKWGVCKWWVLRLSPSEGSQVEAWRGWGGSRSKHTQNAEKNWLKAFALSFPSVPFLLFLPSL